MYITDYVSPIGKMTLASDGGAVIGAWFRGQEHFPASLKKAERRDDLAVFAAAKTWLDAYFAGKNPDIRDLPLLPSGDEFQRNVWYFLTNIPYGKTVTYKTIARSCGDGSAVRAVSRAVENNPIAVLIPSHRILDANGRLTKYPGGLYKKKRLLRLEGIAYKENKKK